MGLIKRGKNLLSSHAKKVERVLIQWVTLFNLLYRSGTVNSKSFIGKVLLKIKWKFELTFAL